MKREVIERLQSQFDTLAKTVPNETTEFWYARDLQEPLGYNRWENFIAAIKRAIESCKTTGYDSNNHFRGVTKMVNLGSGAERSIEDFMLTRYACYLIAQNGDPRKEPIAFAQSYFALQTRKLELIEERMHLQSRLEARERLRESEKTLSQNIYERGVDDVGFGRIRSKGDSALFGGLTTQAMKNKHGITPARPLADFLPMLTIAAKNLATEMTNHNVQQDDLQGETSITGEHVQNNLSVRDMLGQRGIKPENLPLEEDIKKLERLVKSEEKKLVKQSGNLPNSKDEGIEFDSTF
jgi:DNA-damage-inducible protein D